VKLVSRDVTRREWHCLTIEYLLYRLTDTESDYVRFILVRVV